MLQVFHTNEYYVYLGSHLCVVLFYFGTFRFRRVATESFTGTEGSEEGGERTGDRLASNFCCQLCEAFFEGQFQYCVSELVPLFTLSLPHSQPFQLSVSVFVPVPRWGYQKCGRMCLVWNVCLLFLQQSALKIISFVY